MMPTQDPEYCNNTVRSSYRLSVTRVDQAKKSSELCNIHRTV